MGLINITFYITFVGIWIFSSEISPCEPSRVILTEGELGVLEFEYHSVPNGEVQLTIGHRQPFYDAGNLDNAGLSESQRGRFSVVVNGEVHNYVEVQISNVSREDAGTFIFDVVVNHFIEKRYRHKITVDVSIPPGKACCIPVSGHNVNNVKHINSVEEIWTVIECFAHLGTEPGIFECYQSGEQTPLLTKLSQNETTLMQKVLIKRSIRIYCCTSTVGKPKRRCGCNDYIWDPVTHVRSQGLDPCPPIIPVQPKGLKDSTTVTTRHNIHSETSTSGDFSYSDQDDQTGTTGHTPEDLDRAFFYLKLITAFSGITVVFVPLLVINFMYLLAYISKVKENPNPKGSQAPLYEESCSKT